MCEKVGFSRGGGAMSTPSSLSNRTGDTARWSLRTLGGFDLRSLPDGERLGLPGKRERVLLAYLALSPRSRQPRRKLAALLWPDAAEEAALDNLRTCLWGLRKAFGGAGSSAVSTEGEDIVLGVHAFDVDILKFRRLAVQADPDDLQAAAALCSGEFLSGLAIPSSDFESWRQAETARCREQMIEVLIRLMTKFDERNEPGRVIETGLQVLTLDPLHEAAARCLMRLYAESGRRGAAIQLYRALTAALRAELDTEPESKTRAVFTEIARGGPGTAQGPGTKAIASARISLAVLPFRNLSRDVDQEFFSDGMTEEITAALAQIRGLQVVGRTSAFEFKGENKDLRAIGQALGASYLIEGAVRKFGNRVRITAQLVHVAENSHLWAQSYDRELIDVFAIQENIAQAIAASLEVPLGLSEVRTLIPNRTSDTESYQDYLRAKALVRARGALEPGGPLTEAIQLLEQVVARDPNYARAWGLLGQTYGLIASFSAALVNGWTNELRHMASDTLQRAETAAQQATRLDPSNIDGYTALAFVSNYRGAFARAEDLFLKVLSLDAGNPEALHQYSLMLAGLGRVQDALPMRLRLKTQEPLVPVFNRGTAEVLWVHQRSDEAIAILNALPPTFGPRIRLAEIFASIGRYGAAADALQGISKGIFAPGEIEEAVRLLRSAPMAVPQTSSTLHRTRLGFVFLYAGTPDCVLDYFEHLAATGYPALGNPTTRLWTSAYAPVRKTARFKAIVERTGMVAYWRARGWPYLCRPSLEGGFICE